MTIHRTGVFAARLPIDGPPTLVLAECRPDLLGNPVVSFRCWRADDAGRSAWRDGSYLRADLARAVVELLQRDDAGDLSITDVWDLSGAAAEHLRAVLAADEPSHCLDVLRALTHLELEITAADEGLIDRCARSSGGSRAVRRLIAARGLECF